MKLDDVDTHENPNSPILDAAEAYVALIAPLQPRVYSGLKKLFLLSVTGTPEYHAQTYVDRLEILYKDSKQPLINQDYVQYAIKSNICNWLDTLKTLILARLEQIQSLPAEIHSAWVNTDNSRRFYYSPSMTIVRELEALIQMSGSPYEPISQTPVRNSAFVCLAELSRVMRLSGIVSPTPRCDDILIQFVNCQNSLLYFFGGQSVSFDQIHLPLLQIYIVIARLLMGAVSIGYSISETTVVPQAVRTMQLSDSTLAALPAPTFASILSYAEPDAPFISGKARTYLSRLTTYYTTALGE